MHLQDHLWLHTPLFELAVPGGGQVYVKMDCYQPSGSFKIRGMDYAVKRFLSEGYRQFIASSGGNAGYSLAYVCRKRGLHLQVVVPETTSANMIEKIRRQGAEVIITGENWNAADAHARKLLDQQSSAVYVSPFDHPYLWEGHASIIDECAQHMSEPDLVVLAVGGGGLLCGVMQGLERNGWRRSVVIAAETTGAASYQAAMKAGRPISIDRIDTVASSLGARQVADEAFRWSHLREIRSHIVDDKEAVLASHQFANEWNVITEPACGAALSYAYQNREIYGQVLVIACGGVSYNADSFPKLVSRFS